MARVRQAMACLVALAAVASASTRHGSAAAPGGTVMIYVGTYTDHGSASKGIYRLRLDLKTGALEAAGSPAESVSPSFLALHPSGRFLYAVNEASTPPKDEGAVSAFAVDARTGELTALNRQSSRGGGPCHLSLDAEGRHVLVANYGGGNVAVLPVEADGRLDPATTFVQHQGHGADPRRQKAPHAHYIDLDRANRFALVADLGLDEVLVYRFDAATGALTPNAPAAAHLAPGAGPRHLALHPDGRHAYVINEMASTITAFAYDARAGTLSELQTLSTLPGDFHGDNSTAEIAVRPDGRFVYGSNRGHDSIAVFAVDAVTGKLAAAGHQPTLGKTPRNFAIDPSGAYLLAANQDSDTITVFRIDRTSGALSPVGSPVPVPRPVCVLFQAPISRR
ncbi:MAG: 6-phosphogluconolactonase [Acidobacteria bacterium]|nr:MAG: 6-phosphogluconolactonase [Acidobacteriota bacterium]